MKKYSTIIIVGLLSLFVSTTIAYGRPLAANPASGATSNGQTLEIAIDTPADGSIVIIPPGQVQVSGRTTIGRLRTDTNILYIVDVSSSTEFPETEFQDCNGNEISDTGDNFNGDLDIGNTLDCEINGVISLNKSLASMNIDGLEGGLIAFGSLAAVADMSPAAGQQDFVSLLDPASRSNLNEVARSLDSSVLLRFTPKFVGVLTNFNFALDAMNNAFAGQPADERNIAFFLSDGTSELPVGLGTPLGEAVAAGTVVNTFSIGNFVAGCNPGATLRMIADDTGGRCVEVPDPSDLSAILPNLNPAGIDRVEVRLNDGAPKITLPDPLGNWSADLSELVCGPNSIEATVVATDGTPVTAAITVQGNCSPSTSITIVKQTMPTTIHDFDFTGDLGDFTLTSDSSRDSQTFEVPAGDYVVMEKKDSFPDKFWALLSVVCRDQNDQSFFPIIDKAEFSATISLETNQELTCIFLNQGANVAENDYIVYLPFVVQSQ